MVPVKVYPVIKCVDIACNLRCEYCFYRYLDQQVKSESIMTDEMLTALIKQLLEVNPTTCEFLWHGGEPLIAGISFFERVVELQSRLNWNGARMVNSIQTNGALLDDRWASFLKIQGFKVGISIDGPEHIHDHHRANVGGGGSFKTVMRGIERCRKEGIDAGAIAVVTAYSSQFSDEMYDFFLHSGFRKLSLNPAFETDQDGKLCEFSVSDEQFGVFSERLLRRWLEDDDPGFEIRQFTEPLRGMLGGSSSACVFAGNCKMFLDIHPNGDVRPCHSIRGEAPVFGNLRQHRIAEILTRENYQQFVAHAERLPADCLSCRWLPICHGGCTDHRNAMIDGKMQEKYVYCGSRKRTFTMLRERVTAFAGESGA